MAHIRKRTSKSGATSYQVVIESSRQDPVTGKRYRTYKTFSKKKDAEKAMTDMQYNMNRGTYADSRNMSLETLMTQWLVSKELSLKQTTKVRYKEQVQWYILPILGKYPLEALNAAVIQKWITDIYRKPPTVKNAGQGLSPKTVKNIFLNLKAALDYAVDLNLISRNPCEHVNLPIMQKHEAQAYTPDEIHTILTQAKGTDLYFPIYLLLHTGMRKGELLGLRWQDVHIGEDDKHAYIEIIQTRLKASNEEFIDTPKSASSHRKIFISEQARQEFISYNIWCRKVLLKHGQKLKPDDLVIIRADGKTDSPDNFSKRWRVFLEKNNIRKLKLHCLRHTCATMLLKNNVDIKTISARLGHSDTTMVLNVYGHALDSTSQEAAAKMDSILDIS